MLYQACKSIGTGVCYFKGDRGLESYRYKKFVFLNNKHQFCEVTDGTFFLSGISSG